MSTAVDRFRSKAFEGWASWEERIALWSPTGRVPSESRRVMQGVYDGKECVNRCGNCYLTKGMTIESEVADTEGSTATGAPL